MPQSNPTIVDLGTCAACGDPSTRIERPRRNRYDYTGRLVPTTATDPDEASELTRTTLTFVFPAVHFMTEPRRVQMGVCAPCASQAERIVNGYGYGAPRCRACNLTIADVPYNYLRARGLTRAQDGMTGTGLHRMLGAAQRALGDESAMPMEITGSFYGNSLAPGSTLPGRPRELYCAACVQQATLCPECGTVDIPSLMTHCGECAETTCAVCWDRRHAGCGSYYDEGGYDDDYDAFFDRSQWRAREGIYEALQREHAPGSIISSTRLVGMEVETSGGEATPVVQAEAGAAVPILASVGTDGSVNGRNPVEYRMLPHAGAWLEYAIRNMHTWCRDAGYTPNQSAGVHMHIDYRDMSNTSAWFGVAALFALEPLIMTHAAPHRANNSYCKVIGPRVGNPWIDSALANARAGLAFHPEAFTYDRYFTINLQAWSQHNTIEIRAFDTAHDDESISRYLDVAALVTAAVDFAKDTTAFEAFLASTPGRAELRMRRDGAALLAALVVNGHLPVETAMRISQRAGLSEVAGVEAPAAVEADLQGIPGQAINIGGPWTEDVDEATAVWLRRYAAAVAT